MGLKRKNVTVYLTKKYTMIFSEIKTEHSHQWEYI